MMSELVHIVDDDRTLRKTLTNLFAMEEIASKQYDGAEEFIQKIEVDYRPGCLVLDLRMPGMSGLELQNKIGSELAHWPIIFLTGHGQVHSAVEALKKGAMEFFEKPVDNEVLLQAVRSALAKSRSLSIRAEMRSKLTSRECEVLDCLEYGMPIKEMAEKLAISEKTVEFHRANVRNKINTKVYKQHRV